MNRILIVTVNWLGDALMTTPALRAIKENFPLSFIAVMAVERVAPVFKDNPYVDEVIIFDERTTHRSFIAKLGFVRALRAKHFDTCFLIHRSFTRALIAYFSGIPTRIAYRRVKSIGVVNMPVDPPPENIHRQDYYLYLFEKAGIKITNKDPQFFVPDAFRARARENLEAIRAKHPLILAMHPSANWDLKRWPAEHFALLADKLIAELNCAVIFIGAKKDCRIVDNVIKQMRHSAYDFCGKTDLKELAAILENMKLFISNDSGPAHLCVALGVNSLVLFGPTSADITAPRSACVKIIKSKVECEIPCYNLSCDNNRCM
ncbi:MAG: lipopolysaccharide heptosyltransferase II, partial [Candidatus Omnitrophica bacterium]|nr:lipopolysaccharide heptosyltransferase II [Candidatus Omnitrophota bacterium]